MAKTGIGLIGVCPEWQWLRQNKVSVSGLNTITMLANTKPWEYDPGIDVCWFSLPEKGRLIDGK